MSYLEAYEVKYGKCEAGKWLFKINNRLKCIRGIGNSDRNLGKLHHLCTYFSSLC